VREQVEAETPPRPPKRYPIDIPAEVWDRYAQRAREQHTKISWALADALRRDDERIIAEAEEVQDARRAFRKDVQALAAALRTQNGEVANAGPAPGSAGVEARLRSVEEGITEARQHLGNYGVALAAILKVLHERGWISKPLAAALQRDGWI
jgi:hypothetical protein